MILDIFVFSGLSYSIFGNLIKYIKIRKNIDNSIKKLEGNTDVLIIKSYVNKLTPPTYIHTGAPGVMLPIHGKITVELENLIVLLRNNDNNIFIENEASRTIYYDITYANNYRYLDKNIYNKYKISNNNFPITFPLKIYEKSINKPLYHNDIYYDLCRKKVFRETIIRKRLPLTFSIFGVSSVILALSWCNYANEIRQGFVSLLSYPIFHKKRYINL